VAPADGDRELDMVLWAPVNRAPPPIDGAGVDSGVTSLKSCFVVGGGRERDSATSVTSNGIPPSAQIAGRSSRSVKGCRMNSAERLIGSVAPQQNPATDVIMDSVVQPTPRVISTAGARPSASPVRLTLAPRLGNTIDGAWWPRTGLISRELPELISVLDVRLGQVIDINVNWSSLQRQPDLNYYWWQGIRPHIMTVSGRDARAKLLIVPHRTSMALAVMILCRAAGLPIYAAHRDSHADRTAECIVRVARGETMFEVRRSRRGDFTVIAQGRED
jgi:hypothetical protein